MRTLPYDDIKRKRIEMMAQVPRGDTGRRGFGWGPGLGMNLAINIIDKIQSFIRSIRKR